MQIQILELIEGAKAAKGLTVIIDVFRAFSVACYAIESGASLIIPVRTLDQAFKLKLLHPAYKLVGERGGIMPEGFQFGNSPFSMMNTDLTNQTLVHTTSAGTQGIINAREATEIITGAFVNADAIVQYIQLQNPTHVSLVAMGWGGEESTDEDTLCATYIRDRLLGLDPDFNEMKRFITEESKTGNFLDVTDRESAPVEDFELCLQLNRFPFVLKVIPYLDELHELQVIKMN
jgi:2-phosphosulfolactate phosphatase